ncbi:DUF7314 family protein [Halohasta litorea]|uniref:DUF7314 domain-containing protein n=1 Tax=Halohasta litorea TaxID=869891 RepID=A0ABD6D6V2_9EURY|nr:hypothetical protein [Halohasta litorea]MEA1931303.1 hypothetical protein [Euryarchaeota archaeon]
MADEFIKGFGILTGAGLVWMVLAGWYQTPSFFMTNQLIAPPPEPGNVFDAISIFLIDVFLWTAILGALTFWILIPAGREAAAAIESRRESS